MIVSGDERSLTTDQSSARADCTSVQSNIMGILEPGNLYGRSLFTHDKNMGRKIVNSTLGKLILPLITVRRKPLVTMVFHYSIIRDVKTTRFILLACWVCIWCGVVVVYRAAVSWSLIRLIICCNQEHDQTIWTLEILTVTTTRQCGIWGL